MTLTICQKIILQALFIEPEDPRGFQKLLSRERELRLRKNPEEVKRKLERTRRWHEKNRVRRAKYKKDNAKYFATLSRKSAERIRDKFNLLKMERPCYDCGGMFPPHMTDWDHLPQFEKKFAIGPSVRCKSMDSVIDEIAKCQLVCANCHRERTKIRREQKG